ncbi:hypothetical protein D3C85_1167420 [compost metagenome]
MDVGGVDRRAQQRPGRAGVHRNLFAPRPLPGQAGIARGLFQAHVAGHGGDGTDLQLIRRSHGQEQRHYVIGAGVGIDNQVNGRSLGASRQHGHQQYSLEQTFGTVQHETRPYDQMEKR